MGITDKLLGNKRIRHNGLKALLALNLQKIVNQRGEQETIDIITDLMGAETDRKVEKVLVDNGLI